MSIEDIKTPDYRKKHKYDNLNSVDRVIKESQDLLNESIRHTEYLDGLSQDIVRFTFNCPGFKGSGYSADPIRDKGEYIPHWYKPYFDYKGRLIVELQVLNRKRLARHTVNIKWTKEPLREIETANKLKIYNFKKGKGQNGYNFYIKEPIYKSKKVYAGSVLYDDKTLINSVKYAIRELYLYGVSVHGVAWIIKYLTRYKGENNININLNI